VGFSVAEVVKLIQNKAGEVVADGDV
jgi:hypothetical protein